MDCGCSRAQGAGLPQGNCIRAHAVQRQQCPESWGTATAYIQFRAVAATVHNVCHLLVNLL